MTSRFRYISGSLNALLVLEAVVRNRGFTRAGAELHLSQPTISRHIATLESRLKRPLFARNGNQVLPSVEAERLAAAVSLGFGHAESAWEEVLAESDDDQLTLACSFGFAQNWLMPRYGSLKSVLGNIRLRIATFDKLDFLDMSRIDIAVVWDTRMTPERPSFTLFTEVAFPICSPAYLRRLPQLDGDIEALANAQLVHFDVGDSGFLNWRLWFAAQGIDYRIPDGTHLYDTLPFATQAILDGEGVGIGWQYLADQMLADGRVVQIGPAVANRKAAYYLQYRENGANEAAVTTVADWFRQAIHA
jgi:DNA-binding transcriptional LysR family regulator